MPVCDLMSVCPHSLVRKNPLAGPVRTYADGVVAVFGGPGDPDLADLLTAADALDTAMATGREPGPSRRELACRDRRAPRSAGRLPPRQDPGPLAAAARPHRRMGRTGRHQAGRLLRPARTARRGAEPATARPGQPRRPAVDHRAAAAQRRHRAPRGRTGHRRRVDHRARRRGQRRPVPASRRDRGCCPGQPAARAVPTVVRGGVRGRLHPWHPVRFRLPTLPHRRRCRHQPDRGRRRAGGEAARRIRRRSAVPAGHR